MRNREPQVQVNIRVRRHRLHQLAHRRRSVETIFRELLQKFYGEQMIPADAWIPATHFHDKVLAKWDGKDDLITIEEFLTALPHWSATIEFARVRGADVALLIRPRFLIHEEDK